MLIERQKYTLSFQTLNGDGTSTLHYKKLYIYVYVKEKEIFGLEGMASSPTIFLSTSPKIGLTKNF